MSEIRPEVEAAVPGQDRDRAPVPLAGEEQDPNRVEATSPSLPNNQSRATPHQGHLTENSPPPQAIRTDQELPDNSPSPGADQHASTPNAPPPHAPPPPPGLPSSAFLPRVRKLSRWLPHLEVLSRKHPVESSAVLTVIDHIPGSPQPVELVSRNRSTPGLLPHDVLRWVNNPNPRMHDRIIIAEDLTLEFMEGLDMAFTLNPEMFAEHLSKSKYGYSDDEDSDAPEDEYNEPSDHDVPATWNFRCEKDYASLRWFRPIYRETRKIPLRQLEKLKRFGHARWEERGERVDDRDKRMIHSVRRDTNIYRQERHLSAVPGRLLELENLPILASVEERATIYRRTEDGQELVLLLLDPLPMVSYSKKPTGKSPRKRDDRANDVANRETILPFTHICPRSPAPIRSLRGPFRTTDYEQMEKFFESTRSTAEDIEGWLNSAEVSDVFGALLQVVSSDMHNFLRLLSVALSNIALGTSDDTRMQELLAHWRVFVNSYQAELPDIKQSLEDFRTWVYGGIETESTDKLFNDLKQKFDMLINQTEKAHEALRAEMSILESKRGIAEAEGVSKLTELAFVYIPLTFAASLFSMQVRPLKDPAPLSAFVTACVVLMVISYGTRLFIRSTFVLEMKRGWFSAIRRQPGTEERIPTHTFIKWALSKLWNFVSLLPHRMFLLFLRSRILSVSILALGGLVAILAPFWTNIQLDVGFKIAMTLLLVGMILVAGFLSAFLRGSLVVRSSRQGFPSRANILSLINFRWEPLEPVARTASVSRTSVSGSLNSV